MTMRFSMRIPAVTMDIKMISVSLITTMGAKKKKIWLTFWLIILLFKNTVIHFTLYVHHGSLISHKLQNCRRNNDASLIIMLINPFHALYLRWVLTMSHHVSNKDS